ncbi:sporulation protein YabP [Clostridiaceae bacterium NSJ-31]|uniref:Sporulation protein YabP n=1 Tax=Ligaoa zhengdingensis TaxID=2763658 RepID=A0A926DXA8_9FIRM|nr:sporulation protein YabP [Ligaoa zhengdingensis]MBC8545334.1 sporulation protein YabP [Ligaoa zhengdingensis]
MAEEKKLVKMPHNLILEDRHTLTVSGVEDIDSFDEETVVLFTDMGELTIKGESLHINKLNVDTGELNVEGQIHSLVYTNDDARRGGGLFARLFR